MKKTVSLLLSVCILLTLAACGAEQAKPLPDIYNEIKQNCSLPEMAEQDGDYLESYYGLSADNYDEYVFAVSEDALLVDAVLLFRCKEDNIADNTEAVLNKYLKQVKLETESYNPANFKIASQSEVVRNGKFVALVITDNYSEAMKYVK